MPIGLSGRARRADPIVSFALAAALSFAAAVHAAPPKVVLISLDGATPRFVEAFMRDGTIPHDRGLGLLKREGLVAERNVTVNPSLTAPGHIAIATGSTAARNDIPSNTFHLVASPFATTISGFGAPIGGYTFTNHVPEESDSPTAEPLWLALRAAKMKVITATFPGGDGADIRVPGLAGSPIIQSAAKRTVDYTVPFGAFDGPNSSAGAPAGARGFVLNASQFADAPPSTVAQLTAAGKTFFGTVKQTTAPVETITAFSGPAGGRAISVAALDTTNDGVTNYDTLVFFDQAGIQPGPFALPSTGPAYVKASEQRSGRFFIEGSGNKSGVGFYVTFLAPDLSTVRFSRSSANFIPRNAPVLANVDDINNNVGFWAPQADFRIPERLSPGYDNFPDIELEAVYEDLVRTFVDYQTRVALRAMDRVPDADLAMVYIEQPDGSEHQFLMIDPRQASNPRDPTSIGANQDPAKRARYMNYLRAAYQAANGAVERIIQAVGTDGRGRPLSDIIVVSDHGFAPFHTAVNMSAFLTSRGFDAAKVRAITSGPAANIYISLKGREPNGVVEPSEYLVLQQQLVAALREFRDVNPNYVGRRPDPVFDQVFARPTPKELTDPTFGLGTSRVIGQDSGDVYATLSLGYNFDGMQTPVVRRLGDPDAAADPNPVLSVPNFYGAHGYDPRLKEMSAIFFAAGPAVCERGEIERVRNIDVAPTILRLLDVDPAATVQGRAIDLCRRGHHHDDHHDHHGHDD
ncbi:MAG TPA: alkaline phosphatase family protein [Burkholderiales bacterium]|nr:alkaline phosphatase family protein [Burkholderiales bacterium]